MRSLVHESDISCEFWHKRLGHLHHGVLSFLNDMSHGVGIAGLQG
jgi:hypothetical protein